MLAIGLSVAGPAKEQALHDPLASIDKTSRRGGNEGMNAFPQRPSRLAVSSSTPARQRILSGLRDVENDMNAIALALLDNEA